MSDKSTDGERNGWNLKRSATPSQAIPIPSSRSRRARDDAFSLPTQIESLDKTEHSSRNSSLGTSYYLGASLLSSSVFFSPPEDEHVTVWEPSTGKTVAGNAAPYRKNLKVWLDSHPGWEEKADELKSSKRRSLLRRQKQTQLAFASMLLKPEIAYALKTSVEKVLEKLQKDIKWHTFEGEKQLEEEVVEPHVHSSLETHSQNLHTLFQSNRIEWSTDEVMRLQEALVFLGEEAILTQDDSVLEDVDKWKRMTSYVFQKSLDCDEGLRQQNTYVLQLLEKAVSLIENGLQGLSIPHEISQSSQFSTGHSPGRRLDEYHSSNNDLPPLSLTHTSFSQRSHREPRVTVWDPKTGRTISGNAAPCMKNLETWMALHPGWIPKAEEHLSSARRGRHRKMKSRQSTPDMVASSAPAVFSDGHTYPKEDYLHYQQPGLSTTSPKQLAESPVFSDALEGLLLMQICHPHSSQGMARDNNNPSSSSVSSGSQEKPWDRTTSSTMECMDMELEEQMN
eukprot:jgi/Galph1/565/GphlegSOOS_G5424.1